MYQLELIFFVMGNYCHHTEIRQHQRLDFTSVSVPNRRERQKHRTVPESDGSSHRVIAVDDREDPFDKLVHIEDLL